MILFLLPSLLSTSFPDFPDPQSYQSTTVGHVEPSPSGKTYFQSQCHKEEQKEKSSTCWSTASMATTASARLCPNQELGASLPCGHIAPLTALPGHQRELHQKGDSRDINWCRCQRRGLYMLRHMQSLLPVGFIPNDLSSVDVCVHGPCPGHPGWSTLPSPSQPWSLGSAVCHHSVVPSPLAPAPATQGPATLLQPQVGTILSSHLACAAAV